MILLPTAAAAARQRHAATAPATRDVAVALRERTSNRQHSTSLELDGQATLACFPADETEAGLASCGNRPRALSAPQQTPQAMPRRVGSPDRISCRRWSSEPLTIDE